MDLKASLSLRDNFTKTLKSIDSSLTKSANEMARFDSASAAFGTTFQKNVKSVIRESQTVEQAVKKMQTTLYNGFEDVNGRWRDASGKFSKESMAIKAEAAAMAGEVRHQFERMKPPESTGNAFIDFFNRISHRAKDMSSRMAQNFRQAMSQIPSVVETGTSKIISLFSNLGNRIKSIDWMKGITEGIPKALNTVRNFVSNAVNLFKNMGNKMLTPLRAVTNGFRSMKDSASRYLDQVKAKFDSTSQGVVSFTDRLKNAVKTFMVLKTLNSVINTVSSNLSSSFDRVDTLERYPRLLTSMGYTAEQAKGSMDKLASGIKGLPTALDDIVATTQQMTVLTGNVEKATDLTLALNNGFLASGSTSSDASRGMVQFTQMLSRNEVDIISWRTLMESMPYALTEVGKSLGKASMWDLYDSIKAGEMSVEDLGDAFIKLNTEGGKLFEMAKEQSRGFANSMALIGFSFERGFANITMGINERLRELGLPDIPQMLANFAGKIDNVFGWIVPRVPAAVDKVIAGFNKMKEIGGMVKDFLPDMPEIPWLNNLFKPLEKVTNKFKPISDKWRGFNEDIGSSISGLHKVVSGDNLWALAEKYYGDGTMWNKIYEANKQIIDDPWWIFPDQEFVIPGITVTGGTDGIKNWFSGLGDSLVGKDIIPRSATVEQETLMSKLFGDKGFKDIIGESFTGLGNMGENHKDVAKLALSLLAIKPAATAAKFGFDLLLYGLTKHPLAIATAGILGLATGMGYLYENNEGFRKGFDETLTSVRQSRLFTQLESSISKVGDSVGSIEWGDIFTDPGKVGGQIWSSLTTIGSELVRVAGEVVATTAGTLTNAFRNINWGDLTSGAMSFVSAIGTAIADKMPRLGEASGALVGSMINAGKDILNTFSNTILGLEADDPLTTEKLLRAMWKGSGDLLGWAAEAAIGFGDAFRTALYKEVLGIDPPTTESQTQAIRDKAVEAKKVDPFERTVRQNLDVYRGDIQKEHDINFTPKYNIDKLRPQALNPNDMSQALDVDFGINKLTKAETDYGTFFGNLKDGFINTGKAIGSMVKGISKPLLGLTVPNLGRLNPKDIVVEKPVKEKVPTKRSIKNPQRVHQPGHSYGPIQPQPYLVPLKPKPIVGPVGKGIMTEAEKRISQIVNSGTASLSPVNVKVPMKLEPRSNKIEIPQIDAPNIKPVNVDVPISSSVGSGISAPTISTEGIKTASRVVQANTQQMDNNVQTTNTVIVRSVGSTFTGIQQSATSGMTGMSRSVATGNSQSQTSFSGMRSSVVSTTGSAMSSVGSLATSGMTLFTGAVGSGMTRSVGATSSGTGRMVGVVGSMRGGMYSAGLYSMLGLASGINAGAGSAIAAAANVASRVRSTITSALRIASPSRVMEQIGLWVSQGLARGITFGTGFVEKASQRIADYSIPVPEVSFAGAGNSSGSSTTTIHKSIGNITINIDGSQDAKVVAQEVIDMINDAFESDLE